jgi:hypothetical protein
LPSAGLRSRASARIAPHKSIFRAIIAAP